MANSPQERSKSGSERAVSRRTYLKIGGLAAAGIGTALTANPTAARGAHGGRGARGGRGKRGGPIVSENNRAGDDGWKEVNAKPYLIDGYTRGTSVAPGETIELCVSTTPAERYRVEIYRLGWYDGDGGRLVTTLPTEGKDTQGICQPVPEPKGETALVECDWEVTDTVRVTKHWTTGLYVARFVLTTGKHAGKSTRHSFVVRPRDRGRTSAIVLQVPDATANAYNGWGGKSLYGFTSDGEAADAVSYARPNRQISYHLGYAVSALRFLEKEGYDVSYLSDVDVHRDPELLRNHELAISAGHDEYWSRAQRVGFEEARDSGTNLAFLGANTAFWQVRYEDGGQTMVGYKEDAETADPLRGTKRVTDLLRRVGLPEWELLGVQGVGAGLYKFPNYTVTEEALDHPWMCGTGFETGDEVIGCVGHEWDRVRDPDRRPSGLTTFFHYEAGTSEYNSVVNDQDADAVSYEASSGARVFSAGTLGYTWRIDPDPTWYTEWPFSKVVAAKPEVREPDPRLQRFTRNVLGDLGRPN